VIFKLGCILSWVILDDDMEISGIIPVEDRSTGDISD
jgi:hypothetical protein